MSFSGVGWWFVVRNAARLLWPWGEDFLGGSGGSPPLMRQSVLGCTPHQRGIVLSFS